MVGAWGDKAAQRMSAGQVRSGAGAGARDRWSVERRRGERDALAVARRQLSRAHCGAPSGSVDNPERIFVGAHPASRGTPPYPRKIGYGVSHQRGPIINNKKEKCGNNRGCLFCCEFCTRFYTSLWITLRGLRMG